MAISQEHLDEVSESKANLETDYTVPKWQIVLINKDDPDRINSLWGCNAIQPCPKPDVANPDSKFTDETQIGDDIVTPRAQIDAVRYLESKLQLFPTYSDNFRTTKSAIIDENNFAIDIDMGKGYKGELSRVIMRDGKFISEENIEEIAPLKVTSHYTIY